MARKSGFVRRNNRMVRETLWAFDQPTDTALGAASTAVLLTAAGAGLLALRPFTIIRSRGFFHVISDQVAAAETYGASLGHCIVSDQAAAIGVTAVSTPDTDRGSDLWYVFEDYVGRLILNTAVGADYAAGGPRSTVYYDSKAMRKVEEGQTTITVIESMAIASSAQVKTGGRFLIKLH